MKPYVRARCEEDRQTVGADDALESERKACTTSESREKEDFVPEQESSDHIAISHIHGPYRMI